MKGQTVINKPLAKSSNQFPVVGIGASAGGLEAFQKLIKAIPEKSGMAYVLVQHLDPNHESLLPQLLQKVSNIPVLQITDEIKVKPDHIYIIPSNKILIANDGVLELSLREIKNKRHMPIDVFFNSLAEVHQAHAIGVVLSGTATDGTEGLRAIKGQGGATFAQDEVSAAYNGMPHSAVQAGVVDFVLAPEKIPEAIARLVQNNFLNITDEQNMANPVGEVFKKILFLLQIHKGNDFTYYKQATIRRRILRRMALSKNEELTGYLQYLEQNKTERGLLYQDLLIPVTSFFRDTKIFRHLCEIVLPLLVKNKPSGNPIRIWVPGCSTGQEAYSLAICFKSFLDASAFSAEDQRVLIFATDISDPAITKARSGIYSKTEIEGLTPQYLHEFFTIHEGGYKANKSIREMCVFAVHNILKDPPYSKLDFISCRNVLIYMEPYLQKKAFANFHYALNPNGLIMLGKSEALTVVPELFVSTGGITKLFKRKDAPGRFMYPTSPYNYQDFTGISSNGNTKSESISTDFQKTADNIMLGKYTPAGIVVNGEMEIVHLRGNTGPYLEPSSGKQGLKVVKIAEKELAFEVHALLSKLKKNNNKPCIKENIPLVTNGSRRNISIEVISLPNIPEPHYLIVFHDRAAIPASYGPGTGNLLKLKISSKAAKYEKEFHAQILEQEIAQRFADMRSLSEVQEADNEVLQSSNEELLSGSEELQSLNEELLTGKEELQSTNENLNFVNQEMIRLNEQVTEARDYAESIITTIRSPLLVLDENLRVKTVNDAFYRMFRVNALETKGAFIYELGNKQWDVPLLRRLLKAVMLQRTEFSEFEITHNFPNIGERVVLLNACMITNENAPEKLILLAIEDITARRQAALKIEESEAFNRTILENSPDCVKILDTEGRIRFMNGNGLSSIEIDDFSLVENKYWWELCNTESRQIIKDGVAKAAKGEKAQLQIFSPTLRGTPRWWDIIVSPMLVSGNFNKSPQILSISRDITEQKNRQLKEIELLGKFKKLVTQAPVAICILKGKDYTVEVANDFYLNLVAREKDMIGRPLLQSLPELKTQGIKELLDNVARTGNPYFGNELELYLIRNKKTEQTFFNFIYQPIFEQDKTLTGIMIVVTEVTEQVIARKKMEAQENMIHGLLTTAPVFICTLVGPDHVFGLVNDRYQQLFGKRKIQGKPILEALPELKGQDYYKELDKVYTTGKPYVGIDVERILARDENLAPEIRYFNFSYQPMYDENKNIYAILGCGYEVTDQVLAKNKILQIQHENSKELEEKVKQRTMELSEANKELQQKNQEIALSKYNKRFLTEFTEKFSDYNQHNEFFNSLVQFIADTIGLDYVIIGKLEQNNKEEFSIRTLAFTAFGKLAKNITYPLPGGPCEQVIHGIIYSYPKECRQTFPKYKMLANSKVEGYLGYPLSDEQGNVVGLIVVMHEKEIEEVETLSSFLKLVARRAEIEFERIRHEGQLEQYNKSLKEKNEELVKMNKELEAFTYVSSHDLQEPLRKIKTFASLVLKTESHALSYEGKDYLKRMRDASGRMQTLIEDLLAYSRININEREFENTDLNKIIEEVKNELKETIKKKNAVIETGDICEVSIIRFQFLQLMHNIIGNALKFSRPGTSPRITINGEIAKGSKFKGEKLSGTKNYCHISISDNGIGFDPQYKDRIFEVFQRLHNKKEYAGTGIGLAIVKKIVDNHYGFITAKSEPGGGATFDIYLPAK